MFKLLANQQEDGDGLFQKIVKLGQRKQRKSHGKSAHLNRGLGTFLVRKPKVQASGPEVTVLEKSIDIEFKKWVH